MLKGPPRRPGVKPLGRQRPPGPSRNIWIGLAVVGMIVVAGVFLYVAQVEESRISPIARFEFESNTGVSLINITYRFGISSDNRTEPTWSDWFLVSGSDLTRGNLEVGTHYYFEFQKDGYYRRYSYFLDTSFIHGEENEVRTVVIDKMPTSAVINVKYTNGTQFAVPRLDGGSWQSGPTDVCLDSYSDDNWGTKSVSFTPDGPYPELYFMRDGGGVSYNHTYLELTSDNASAGCGMLTSGSGQSEVSDDSYFEVESRELNSTLWYESFDDGNYNLNPMWATGTGVYYAGGDIFSPLGGSFSSLAVDDYLGTNCFHANGTGSTAGVTLSTFVDLRNVTVSTMGLNYMIYADVDIGSSNMDGECMVVIVTEGYRTVLTEENWTDVGSVGPLYRSVSLPSQVVGEAFFMCFVLRLDEHAAGRGTFSGNFVLDDLNITSDYSGDDHLVILNFPVDPTAESASMLISAEYRFNSSLSGLGYVGIFLPSYKAFDYLMNSLSLGEATGFDLSKTTDFVSETTVTTEGGDFDRHGMTILHGRMIASGPFKVSIDKFGTEREGNLTVTFGFTTEDWESHAYFRGLDFNYSTSLGTEDWDHACLEFQNESSDGWTKLLDLNATSYGRENVFFDLASVTGGFFYGEPYLVRFVFSTNVPFDLEILYFVSVFQVTLNTSYDVTITVMNMDPDVVLFSPITSREAPWIGTDYTGFVLFVLEKITEYQIFLYNSSVAVFGSVIKDTNYVTCAISVGRITNQFDIRIIAYVPSGGNVHVKLVPTGQLIQLSDALTSASYIAEWG